ncbi:hypothetical protein POREN0001_1554 [Porphyromonas endodontalis ATCC 35406]|uniref:Uncharacterized protein n=1 Tax=Porphyromonas endodontalis (strain ATCC 35406 / DSM 24491 / JCM 8526 / CCUG 16442 / BCRC 14492 / NCTC 13058 / HG 370) TaxID=553175 RepID=C3JA67_POREA|nr:hypothetical protein POREN0001_1554 [Porphyromonas endodontalis ATCC 35406]
MVALLANANPKDPLLLPFSPLSRHFKMATRVGYYAYRGERISVIEFILPSLR